MKVTSAISRLEGDEAAQVLAAHPDLREQMPSERVSRRAGEALTGRAGARVEEQGDRRAGRSLLANPEAGEGEVLPLVLMLSARDRAEADELADVITVARQLLRERNHTAHGVLQALLPEQRLALAPGQSRQVQREAEARAEVADQYGLLSSAQVADQAHSTATNRAALASRWRAEQRLLSVTVDGAPRFPGFQFDSDGRPHPVVAQVLQVLSPHLPEWDITLWFTTANDWLGAITPADALQGPPQDHQALLHAARQLAVELDDEPLADVSLDGEPVDEDAPQPQNPALNPADQTPPARKASPSSSGSTAAARRPRSRRGAVSA